MTTHTFLLLFQLCISTAEAAPAHNGADTPSHQSSKTRELNPEEATRFARLALACVQKEYPNKLGHTLNSDADVKPPRELTPAFYGCYDWHSSVHGHWLLARLARMFPEASFATDARAALERSLTESNIRQEASYLEAPGRASFERPYGLAWLLQLALELREWSEMDDSSFARQLSANLRPLEQAALERLKTWLPKLSHPVRSGEHSQTAFALGLAMDYARGAAIPEFSTLLRARARDFYSKDKHCPIGYEPSGEDFLSPCLAEADVMRRLLAPPEFAKWLHQFLPQISESKTRPWLQPLKSTDPSDPKLAHIDGLNLSRAWMLDGIASGLPKGDARVRLLSGNVDAHRTAGLAAVTGEHYEGGHWLASFAVYLVTRRGIGAPAPSSLEQSAGR